MRLVLIAVLVMGLAGAAQAQPADASAFRQARLDKLLAALSSDNARQLARQQIKEMGKVAEPRLLSELDRRDDYVRVQVILLLNEMGVRKAVPKYLAMLPEALCRQQVWKRQFEEYNDKKQKLDTAAKDVHRGGAAPSPSDYALVETLKKGLPRLFLTGGAQSPADVEVMLLAQGIANMGDEGILGALATMLLESRKDATVHGGQWATAWGPVWDAFDNLLGGTNDPETIRKSIATLRQEADPLQKKGPARSAAEASFVARFEVADLLADARLDKLLYQ